MRYFLIDRVTEIVPGDTTHFTVGPVNMTGMGTDVTTSSVDTTDGVVTTTDTESSGIPIASAVKRFSRSL